MIGKHLVNYEELKTLNKKFADICAKYATQNHSYVFCMLSFNPLTEQYHMHGGDNSNERMILVLEQMIRQMRQGYKPTQNNPDKDINEQ